MLEMNIQQSGMEAAQNAIKMLGRLGAKVYGAELLDSSRMDSDKTNVEIIDRLTAQDRDMFSLGKDEAKTLQMVADKIVDGVRQAMRKGEGEVSQGKANAIMGRVLKNSLKNHIKKAIIPRIENNMTAEGGAAPAVTSEYSGWRAAKFGMPDDPTQVGVASGQLLEAIANGDIRLK